MRNCIEVVMNQGLSRLMRRAFYCATLLTCAGSAVGQPADGQRNVQGHAQLGEQRIVTIMPQDVALAWDAAHEGARSEFVRPRAAAHALVDDAVLVGLLESAPAADAVLANPAAAQPVIALPMPDGSVREFRMMLARVMEDALAVKYPMLRAYVGACVDDASVTVRMEVTNHGLRAQIRGLEDGFAYIDPWRAGSTKHVVSYWLSDASTRAWDWNCETAHDNVTDVTADNANDIGDFATRGTHTLREFRLAIACTGEYGAYQSSVLGNAPNVADAMSALVTITNRSNATFEPDMGVRFVMIANNDVVAFVNGDTDPYSTQTCPTGSSDCSGPLLQQNVDALSSLIGNANFDVGHVVTRLPGGVAGLRVVCGNSKSRGVSGIPRGGENEPVSALVVVHELGHQFGANHSYNGLLGRCGPNWAGATALEPGGGSTQMSYPGACPVGGGIAGDNLVLFADPYFHTASLIEMRTYLANLSATCGQTIDTNNTLPTITSLSATDKFIPPTTPFALSAAISDSNSGQTFVWEQMDNGPQQTIEGPESVDNGTSPLFRSLPPTSNPQRVFPNWTSILAGTDNRGERYARVAGSQRKFRVTVRDNVAGAGGSVSSSIVRVNIADAQPLVVTRPFAGELLRSDSSGAITMTIAWTPTTFPASVATTRVDLLLSVDGGTTWSVIAPNQALADGQRVVNLASNAQASEARVMVRAVNNHFFNVSGAFAIVPPCGSIDFNRDGLFPDDQDLVDLLSVLAGGPCSTQAQTGCDVIDFNRDGLFPDDQDVIAFLAVLAGGAC